MTWISLQPVAGAIENGYGYGSTAISALGITYMIVFLFVNYPSNIVIDKGGLRLAVLIGMGFTFLGMCVKCLVNKSFIWVIIGQILAATIATAAQPIGVAIGFVFPSIFVKAADADPGQ